MKVYNLDPPITAEEMLAVELRWPKSGGISLDRARRVFIERKSIKQVAESDGITRQTVYVSLRRSMMSVLMLRGEYHPKHEKVICTVIGGEEV